MSFNPASIAALVVAVSFAAGLNVYATMLTLGAMARLHWVALPSGLDALASWWVIGMSTLLFSAEFVADKIPGFDLIWNAAHTFVRIPLALLLAYGATSHLSPQLQLLATVAGGAIAALTHGSKLAVRGAFTASPEPFSNIALSATEDATAIGITWTATHHPIVAGIIAGIAILLAAIMARLAVRVIRRLWRDLTGRSTGVAAMKAFILFGLLLLSFSRCLNAQTLARPGWAGSGLTAQPWWKHAVIYEIDVRRFATSSDDGVGSLSGVTQSIDYLQSLGVDAILLDAVSLAGGLNADGPHATFVNPAAGTDSDFDQLIRQASSRNIRVLLSLQENGTSDGATIQAQARFWLSRGVAGFRLADAGPHGMARRPSDALLRLNLSRLLASYVGQRILITAGEDVTISSNDIGKQVQGWLVLDPALLTADLRSSGQSAATQNQIAVAGSGSARIRAAKIRAALSRSKSIQQRGLLLRASDNGEQLSSLVRFGDGVHDSAIARTIATLLLGSRFPALLYAGQETDHTSEPISLDAATEMAAQDPSSTSLVNFYRGLIRLHHGNNALRDGEEIFLNHDDDNALVWVRKPSAVTQLAPAIVVACNLSDKPLMMSLKGDLASLHLRGTFLRTLLRSDDAMGSMHIDPITLPPFGVYIGELRD